MRKFLTEGYVEPGINTKDLLQTLREASDYYAEEIETLALIEATSEPSIHALKVFLHSGNTLTKTAQWMAESLYEQDKVGIHQGIKNDKFCLAHVFNLASRLKRESSDWLVENCMAGYYAHKSPSGFYLSNLLHELDAIDPIEEAPELYSCNNATFDNSRFSKLASGLGLSEPDLSCAAANVINWSLAEGYGVTGLSTSVIANSPLPVSQLEELVARFIPDQAQYYAEVFKQARLSRKSKGLKTSIPPKYKI